MNRMLQPSAGRQLPVWRLYLLPILALLFLDFVPRFFQGDSLSYLSTQIGGWIPPDRSWEFGLFLNFLLRHTHGFNSFIFLQVAVLIGLVEGMRYLFPHVRQGMIGWCIAGLLIAIDPIIEIYTRFFMSDFLAMAFFLVAMSAVTFALHPGNSRGRTAAAVALAVICTFAAVLCRVAYAPITLLSILLTGTLMCRRLNRQQWLALFCVALGPFLAVGSVAGVNRLMFAQEFPGEVFVTKLSGIFLAGVFAPALTQSDFRNANIPITSQEFDALHLDNYDKRVMQVWGQDHSDLQQLIKDKQHVTGDYSAKIDKAGSALVKSALKRDPLALAKVYVISAADYARSSEWHLHLPGEMGLTRPLPDYFLTFANRYSVLKITPDITAIRSLLIRTYAAVAGLYPFQLLLGCIAGIILLIRRGCPPHIAVPCAAFLADLAAAPLYGNYLIARYILSAIFLSYVLIGLAVTTMLGRSRDEA